MNSRITEQISLEYSSRSSLAAFIIVTLYIAIIAAAEGLGVAFGTFFSALCHAILIPILLSHYVLIGKAIYRRMLPALALISLLRILSLSLMVGRLPQIYLYALIGTPLLVAVMLTAQFLYLSRSRLGLTVRSWSQQIFIAFSGLPLSIIAYFIVQPTPIVVKLNWFDVIVGSIILLVFVGFTEEIIFRGILQSVANEIFGSAGIFYSSILFAIMYIGSLSLQYVLFIASIGLFFGWCVNRTRSCWGVVIAHSLINIGISFIWPLININIYILQVVKNL
jgi:uncharacterized protein